MPVNGQEKSLALHHTRPSLTLFPYRKQETEIGIAVFSYLADGPAAVGHDGSFLKYVSV